MANKRELLEIIKNGESSGVEFKRDNIPIQELVREIVAFANYQSGMILPSFWIIPMWSEGTYRKPSDWNITSTLRD